MKYGKTTMYMNIQLHDIFSFFFEMKSEKIIKLTNVNNKMVIFFEGFPYGVDIIKIICTMYSKDKRVKCIQQTKIL